MSPRLKPRAQAPQSDQTYVAHQTFTYGDGGVPTTIGRGTSLRGGHPTVQKYPHYFTPDDGRALPAEPLPPRSQGAALDVDARLYGRLETLDVLRSTRTLRVGVGSDQGNVAKVVVLPAGTFAAPDSELVRVAPDAFEAPE